MKWTQKPLALIVCTLFAPLAASAQVTPPTPPPLVHHFPAGNATTLALFVDGGSLHLIPQTDTPDQIVVVEATINHVNKRPRVEISVSGKNLNLTISGAPPRSLPFTEQATVAYEVHYPSRMRLEIVDQSGDVTVDGPQSPVAIDADAGNVFVHDAHARVDAVADDGNASVDLASGWNADAIRMESANGDIRLTIASQIHGELDATSEDGTVHNTADNLISKAKLPVIFLITEKGNVWITPPTRE